MASSTLTPIQKSEAPAFLNGDLINEMESIPEPALLYLPGGRIAAVNGAAVRLSGIDIVGESMYELIASSTSRRADGSRLLQGDLPFIRALRGEVVNQGERIDIALPQGGVYRAVVTSAPIIWDGKVVAALSVWHDFNRFVRDLAESLRYSPSVPPQ
jgi:PAS domain-containing protein